MKNYKVSLLGVLSIVSICLGISQATSVARAEEKSNNDFALYQDGMIALEQKDYSKAHDIFKSLASSTTMRMEAYIADIKTDIYSGKTVLAQERMDEALKMNPLNLEIRVLKADLLRTQGKFEHAVEEVKKILAVAPNHPDAKAELGYIAFDRGEYEEAVKILSESISLKQVEVFPLLRRAQSYEKLGKFEKAITDYREIIKTRSTNVRLRTELSSVLLKNNQVSDAIKELKFASKINPSSTDVMERLGDIYLVLGKTDECVEAYKKVIDVIPGEPSVSYKLSQIYESQGKLGEEEEVLTKSISVFADNSKIAKQLDALYRKTNQFAKLGNFLKQHIYLNPSELWATMGLAQLYVTLNENTKAVNILERSHEKGVMSVESNLLLAYVLKKSDEPKDAFYVLRDANKTFKDERLVYNMALLAEEIEKFQIAVEKYSELPKSSKLYPKALVNLGLLYEKMGEKEKSISTLEEARSVNLVQRDEIDAKLAQLKGYSSKEGRGLAGKPDSMEESNESGKKKK